MSDLSARLESLSREERAALITLLRKKKESSAAPPPLRAARRDLPLSFAQQRLWFLDRLAPGNPVYNVASVLRLRGRLDVAVLAACLSEIVRRHAALRTRFEIRGDGPVQIIEPPAPLPLPVVDLSAIPIEIRAPEEQRVALERENAPFDLARPPLLRACLLRLGAEEHLLVYVFHHIASDGWSLEVAVGEVAALYPAFLAGQPSPLPELPLQYADFAGQQIQTLQGETLAREIGFWRERLAGASPLELPIDRPRPVVPSFRGNKLEMPLPASLDAGLRQLAREQRATPFMAFLAPLCAFLGRIANADDVVVGTVVAGRDRRDIRDLIGFFVNTLILRLDLSGDPDGRALLAQARQVALEAFEHQALPFEKLVDELGLPRDPYRPPLLRVLYQLLAIGRTSSELPGLTLEHFELPLETATFDLVINAADRPDGLRLVWRYDADLFDPGTILRWNGLLEVLLSGWLEDPARRVSELPLLTETERLQLLTVWSPAPALADRGRRSLPALFEEQVDRTPEAPAVSAEGETGLTYRELDARANRLARWLVQTGVVPGDRVALRLDRSPDLIVSLLGVLKTGAAYVPLDPASPPERLGFALEDSGARLVLDAAWLEQEREAIARQSGERPGWNLDPELPAYVIYTSGSTGCPKGVIVPHGAVSRLFAATAPWFGFGPDDVWTLFHSYAFDFSVWEIWGALLHGGRLVVVPYSVSRDPTAFLDLLHRERVTVLNQTPSAFRQLLWAEGGQERALRFVIFGGEALDPPMLEPWFARHGDERPRLVNMYGITETTVHVTYRPLTREDASRPASRIGQPIPDLTLHVLDRHLQLQPAGVPGEICVSGEGLSHGYLGRPDLTAKRFVPDPFGPAGSRLYRSGDLARRRPDGDLEFLGRIPAMVDPYRAGAARMTDGIHAVSRMLGDVKLLSHGKVDASVAERWRQGGEAPLGGPARAVAAELGYPVSRGAWEDGGTAPASFAQERLWLLDQLLPGTPTYNVPGAIRLHGRLDVGALAQAIGEVVRRHAALRTVFASEGGQPIQTIHPLGPRSSGLPVVDLSALAGEARDAEATRLAVAEAARPFDLETGPLLRTTLLQLGPRENVALYTMHHIVSDGWSMGVFYREVATLYEAFAAGRPSPLPALRLQYPDYALRQRELDEEGMAREVAWWKERLTGIEPLELPTDRPRPAVRSGRGAEVSFLLRPGLAWDLTALGRGERATLYMVLLAAFQAFLQRLARQDDVAVGSPVAHRSTHDVEELIGFFVNTLVMRTDLSGDPTFRELVGRVRRTALDAMLHQEAPFERVVEAVQPERQLSRSPLFQVMFSLQNAGGGAVELPGLTLEAAHAPTVTAKFDLTLLFGEGAKGLGAILEYDLDLFEAATAGRLLRHLETLLEGAVVSPDVRLSDLPLLTPAERETILAAWNRTQVPFPRETPVHRLVAEQAARTPDAVALSFEGEEWTYADLDLQANRLAHRLRRMGAGPEVPVVVLAERSPELIAALLAVMKSGAFFVPLDPSHPRERLAAMMSAAGARLAVTRERFLDLLPEGIASVCLDGLDRWDREEIAAEPPSRVEDGATAGNLLYVMFTSGSTGEPKGVAVTHGNVVRLVKGTDYAELGPGATVPMLAPVSFDASTFELWGPLANGGRIAVFPAHTPALDELAAFLEQRGVTQAFLTTALFHQMAERRPESFAPLRRLLTGGEVVSPALARRVIEALPELRLSEVYGPTESTTFATAWPLDLAEASRPSLSIGLPIANTTAHVLEPGLFPAPIGVWGELCLGGEGLARGYLGRPDLTAERFVPDPFAGFHGPLGGRLYRTGDLARRRPDGALELLGRIDRQVKIRGFRIEPGEVEAALARHPAVTEAAVLVRGEDVDKRLVAYVVATETGDDLRRWLSGRLPEPMVPAAVVVLDSLPLTPNGKVDRQALSRIVPERTVEEIVAPRTPVEETLAGLFVEVLGNERTGGRVGIHDNFFELGGHSLLATRLMAALRDTFQVELPLRVLFEEPTVEGLAEAVAGAVRIGQPLDAPVVPLPREPGVNRFPVSFSQLREWILDRLEPGNPAYNIPNNLRIGGPLEVPVLTEALNRLIERHEVFRTAFVAGEEEPLQAVLPEVELDVPVIDLSALPEAVREAELPRRVRHQAGTGFDLSAAPLLRVRVVRLAAEDHALLMTVHHIISDGWSMGILNQEVAALYEAAAAGVMSSGAPLPPLPVQYADYAAWLRRRLDGETLEQQVTYWRQRLTGAPPLLELPTDRPRPPVRSSRGRRLPFFLPKELAGRLEELALQNGATLFMVLLAGYQALLARWSGQDDVVVGTYSGNRPRRELETLIGFFINTLVLRTDLGDDPSFAALLGRVRETTLEAYAHRDVPFEKLLEVLQLPRDPSRTPLFQALLVLHNFPPAQADLSTGVRLAPLPVAAEKSDYDLSLWLGEVPRGIGGMLEYSTDLFDEPTMLRFAGQLRALLEAAVAEPARNVWTLPLIGEDEQARQLAAWSHGPEVPEGPALLHRLVEEQALRAPTTVAVEAGSVRLTYADLVEQAGRFAEGIRPGTIVALSAERTPELIVQMLGVLRAGAAYLPVDPGYPVERREYMVVDSGAVYPHPLTPSPKGEGETDPVPAPPLPWERGLGGEGPGEAGSVVSPDTPAYLIYTSGSTGRPKGVVVPHRAIASFVRAARETYEIAPGDRVLQFASISFDTSAEEIWPALAAGATLVLRPEDMAASIPHFLRELERLGITVADLPTAFWHELVAGLEAEDLELPRGVRLVILGGEEALADRFALWQRRVGSSVRLVNTYGPTETTIVATRCELSGLAPGSAVPIGRPIPGARAFVLDRFLTPVPPGVRGELWIGGAGVAQGYLGRPDLTADRFRPDPFSSNSRLYRTGDLAVLTPGGDLVFAGRADRQLKIRGYRIEPGEIETALRLHPALRDAVVDVRGDVRRLIAWIVPHEGIEAPGASDLRAFLRERLPEPLLPAAFVPVEALPLTPSGKVDRRSLPEPAEDRPENVAYAEPQSALERAIAEVYRDLLRVGRVGLHDNFFDLGGHSLLIVRAHQRLKEALGKEIPVLDLFRFPTVAALARHLGGEETGNLQKVQGLADQQRAAQQRQKAAMERLRRPGRSR